MTKVSDLSPEEQAAHYAEVRRTLARVDRTLTETANREIPAELWQPPPPDPAPAPESPRRARRAMGPPTPDKVQIPQHGPDGRVRSITTYEGASVSAAVSWESWVKGQIKAALDAFWARDVEPLAGEIGGDLGAQERRIAELEQRLAASEEAAAELLMAMERRIAELEQRAAPQPGLRLVGESDAAA